MDKDFFKCVIEEVKWFWIILLREVFVKILFLFKVGFEVFKRRGKMILGG